MLIYPQIDPVALKIGPFNVYWYGLMYLVGFIAGWLLASYRAKYSDGRWTSQQVADLIFYGAVGVVLGGRIGYMLFYNLPVFLADPLTIFKTWQGGMAFHGGLIGVMLAMWLYNRRYHKGFFTIMDFMAPLVPIGLAAGRLGNFINGELWGRVTDVPWAMVFPTGGVLPRHPSQLYELFLEGIVLFVVLWIYSSKPRPRMAVSGMFALGYGCLRFFCEFFRQPDPQLGFIGFHWLTMGQLLCIPMIVIGIVLLTLAYRKEGDCNAQAGCHSCTG